MKYTLYTLIDITETGERKGPNKVAIGQQSNYDCLIATLGLRANPEPLSLKEIEGSLTKIGFGNKFKNEQKYWQFDFNMPDDAATIQDFENDFDLVPVVTQLSETAELNISAFQTYDTANKNIVFVLADK